MEDKIWKRLHLLFLISYIGIVLMAIYLTCRTAGVGGLSLFQRVILRTNIIPFKDLGTVKQIIASTIIYMPVALLLPNAFRWGNKRKCVYTFCTLLIATIEILQPVTLRGYGDINDVLFGMLGVIIIFEILRYIKK